MSKQEDKVAGMRRNLEAKTGKTVEAWIAALDAQDLHGKEATAWLKGEGVGHFQARLILSDRKASS